MVDIVEAAFSECDAAKKKLGEVARAIKEFKAAPPPKNKYSTPIMQRSYDNGWNQALIELANRIGDISEWEGW